MGALALLYACALVLLLLSAVFQFIPWPAFFAAGWWLLDECERRFADICHVTGRLQISLQGDIRWRGQQWRLQTARIRSGLILVWRLNGANDNIWLPICPDACSLSAYRSLALYSRHFRSISA
ncbi:membrane-bound toxin of toxin-antitoxin system [Photobacterium lutimaris]|nr:membrane-bound toxin of toxin-antitoxin system [Photobacterium lutimaris]